MKRNEMIRIIENNFIGDIRENAELILNVIEKSGMLPPHRPILIGNPNIKTDIDCATLPALIIKDVNSWEPEDV